MVIRSQLRRAPSRPRRASKRALDVVLSMRGSRSDVARLRDLAARLPIPRLTLLREAMRIGLEMIEARPSTLLDRRR